MTSLRRTSHFLKFSSTFSSLSAVFKMLLWLIRTHFLLEPEEQETQRLRRDLSQSAGQETDGTGGGGEETQSPARGYYSEPGHTHPLPPTSRGINKPIMAALHIQGAAADSVIVEPFCLLMTHSDSALRGDCYCCRCYDPVRIALSCNGGQRKRVR